MGAIRYAKSTAMTTLDPADHFVTFINTFAVEPNRAEELAGSLARATEEVMAGMPGFVSANLHVSEDRRRVVNYAQWRSREDYDAMSANPTAQAHMREAAALAVSYDPVFYELRHAIGAKGSS